MTIYITSDLHFGHTNIMKYCPTHRSKFGSVDAMNQALMAEWQSTVRPNDDIYFLGDMSFLRDDKQNERLLLDLPGNITWIIGNHDKHILHVARSFQRIRLKDYAEIKHNGHKIVLCHFPIFSWNGIHRGSLHLHGHAHGSIEHHNTDKRRTDMGWDVHGRILTLDEAVEMTAAKPISTPEGDHHDSARGEL